MDITRQIRLDKAMKQTYSLVIDYTKVLYQQIFTKTLIPKSGNGYVERGSVIAYSA